MELLSSVVASDLPPPSWIPGATAFATGMLLLFGFALPPLVALASVPPLRVLRRDLPRPRAGGVLAYVLGAITIALLIAFQAREVQAGLIMVGGVAGLLALAAFVAWLLLALLKRLPQRGVTWRFGLANLRRRAFASSLQIGALALGFMALLLLTVVRGDLMQQLARQPAARRAESVPRQRAAGPGRRRARPIATRASAPTCCSGRWCAGAWSS